MNRSEKHLSDQITYEHYESKIKLIEEDWKGISRKTKRNALVLKDSSLQILFSTKIIVKKDEVGRYYDMRNSIDTIHLETVDSNYVATEFTLSGTFIPSKDEIRNSFHTDKGIAFKADGTCIKTLITHCTESSCSTTRQEMGEYRIIDHTIHVAFYRSRSYFRQGSKLKDNPIKSIDDVQWHVSNPFTRRYHLSAQLDTLYQSFDSRYGKGKSFLIQSEQVELLPTISHKN